MRIDRGKFLILAAALAPAGCVVTTHDEPVDTNPNASTGSGGSGGGDSPDAATSGAGGSEVADGSAGMSSGGAPAEDGGDPEPQADSASSSGGAAGAGGSGGSGGSTCDDSVGDPPPCDSTNVCVDYDWGIADCNSALTYMKPGPAEIYALCVQSCEDPYLCRDAALVGACPDPTAATDCATIVAGCPNIQESDCVQYLSGLTQAGRDEMVTCTAFGDVFCDLYTCSESIGYTMP